MFNFFRKEQVTNHDNQKSSFEIELTASVLAYEIARIDGIVDECELAILLEEIEEISKKVNKSTEEIFKIIEIYSNDSVSFYEFVHDTRAPIGPPGRDQCCITVDCRSVPEFVASCAIWRD